MSRVPRIRFKGFEEDWEQRKLGEMYTQLVERNIELLPFKKILSVSTMTYKGDGNGAAEESLSSYKRLRVGDIAFEGHTSKDFRYGRFVLNDTGDGIMSPRFSALRPISVMPIKFWKYYIHYEPIMKKILVNSTKSGTMMNELVVEEFLKEILLVPEEHEQQKIGRFFNGIDHLITLHQSKFFGDILKTIASYTLYWEQRKLGEVFEEYSEKNHSELPPLTIIQGGGTIRRDESDRALQYDMNSLSNYKMVNKDDFIVHLRSFEGGLEKANSKGIISPAYHTFSGENTDATFYYTYFRSEKFIESDLKPHVYGIRDGRSIDVEGMKSINIPYTIFEEQRHIGYLIDSINHLITLHQLEPFQLIFKAIAYRIIDYTKSKPPRCR